MKNGRIALLQLYLDCKKYVLFVCCDYTKIIEKTDDGYVMETEGNGFLYFTKYTIVEDSRDLIITGGVLDKERFVK